VRSERRGSFYRRRGNPKWVAGAWGLPPCPPLFMWVDTPLTKCPLKSLHSKLHSNSH